MVGRTSLSNKMDRNITEDISQRIDPCVKCGCVEFELQYWDAGRVVDSYVTDVDTMEVTCARCGHVWRIKPLDR